MKLLGACEESQRVTMEFRKLGHDAYSCDLLDCSGNHPDQIIQPYQYGDAYEKRTCLWLKGLPMLSPTKIVEAGNLSKDQRALVRSKTFPGIAKTMATQWGREESIIDTIISDDNIAYQTAKVTN